MDFLRTLADCKQITVFAKSFFSIKRQEIFRRSPKSAHSDFFAWASAVFRSNSIIRATEFSHENRAAYLRSSAPTAFLLSSSFQRETIALIQGATSDSSGTMRVDAVKRAGTESVSDLLPTTSGRAPRSEPTMGTPLSAPSTATLQKVSSQRDGMSSILLCR